MNPNAETLRYGYGDKAEKIIGRVKSRYFSDLRPTYYCYLIADIVCRCGNYFVVAAIAISAQRGPLSIIGWQALAEDTNSP